MYNQIFATIAQVEAPATPAQPQKPQQDSGMGSILMMVMMIVIFYVLLIRPQAKRQKELTARIGQLKTGDRVVTTGGIHGVVSNVQDGPTLMLKVEDGKLEVDKSAIANILTKDAPAK